MIDKLKSIIETQDKLSESLSNPEIIADTKKFAKIAIIEFNANEKLIKVNLSEFDEIEIEESLKNDQQFLMNFHQHI